MEAIKGILFLGSGATRSSSIKRNSQLLPTDQKFFSDDYVRSLLPKKYPTLNFAREKLKDLKQESLYQTWNKLFIYRGLAGANIIHETEDLKAQFENLKNFDFPSNKQQQNHYKLQFMHAREKEIPCEYYIGEFAIWDLRVLVKEIYSIEPNKPKPIIKFWDEIKENISYITNLNYDTTFDQTLHDQIYYLNNDTSSDNKVLIIRPHGSLDWSSIGLFSTARKRWLDWNSTAHGLKLDELGYNATPFRNIISLKQPLIVTPDDFKEEIIGNSTMTGLNNELLKPQWTQLEKALKECNQWIFFGISFTSGDNHLLHLLRRHLDKVEKLHFSCYPSSQTDYNSDKCENQNCSWKKMEDWFGKGKLCHHPINENGTIDLFKKDDCLLYSERRLSNRNRLSG